MGGLVVQKRVCDKKTFQKTVCDRNSFGTEIINNRSCVKTKRVYDRKNIVFSNSLSKNVDEKGCLKILFTKNVKD